MSMERTNLTEPGTTAAPGAERRRHIEEQLDEALDASFPASDPVAIVTSQHEEAWAEESQEAAPGAPPTPA